MYSNCSCSCSFEAEIIKIGQSSQKMYSNNVLNSQESATILNACIKKSGNLLNAPPIYVCVYMCVCMCVCVYIYMAGCWWLCDLQAGSFLETFIFKEVVKAILNGYNHFYQTLIIRLIICLHTVKWFQVLLSNNNNSTDQVLLCNLNNLNAAVWFQITNNNNS